MLKPPREFALTCYNHPKAPTVATCSRCEVEMCGMCANFFDVGVYCEKCTKSVEAERFVSSRAEQFKKRETFVAQPDVPPEPQERKHSRDRGIIWLGVSSSSVMLFFSLVLYAYPTVFAYDPELAAAQEAAQALEDCRLIFEEIGYLLEADQLPDTSYRCADSPTQNLITRSRDGIRVSHPHPENFGLRSLYVTNSSHEVVFEE